MKGLMVLMILFWAQQPDAFALEEVLIDFSTMTADVALEWRIVFQPSNTAADPSSSVREIRVDGEAPVMEAVIDFSHAPADTTGAVISPPFEFQDELRLSGGKLIPPEQKKGQGSMFDSYGILKNTGVLKQLGTSLLADASGGLGIVLANEQGQETIYSFGPRRDGTWAELTFSNPFYVEQVIKAEYETKSLLPASIPYLRLAGLVVFRPQDDPGARVLLKIKEIRLEFDAAYVNLGEATRHRQIWNAAVVGARN